MKTDSMSFPPHPQKNQNMKHTDSNRLLCAAEKPKLARRFAIENGSLSTRSRLSYFVLSVAVNLCGMSLGYAQTAPTLTPNGGTFTTQQNVFVSTTNSFGGVFFTVNGTAPTTNSLPLLSNSTILISQPTTLKVAAFVGTNSAVTTASFNITGQVGTGVASSVVLRADGTVWTAGDNSVGELGSGNFTSVTTPVQALGLTGCVAVSSGYYHVLALKGNGSVWSWGYNNYGQLGSGNGGINYSIPAQVTGLSGIVSVAGGGFHSLALKNDGSVWSWGYNAVGQLGDWTTTDRAMPVQVQGLPANIVAIAAGAYHSLALDSGGNLYGWGYNNEGELGLGNNFSMLNPQYITNGVAAIGAGQFHSLYVRTDGTVWGTGANNLGQLGNNTVNTTLTPVQVSGLTNAASVAAGYNFSAALASNGVVWSWGDNSSKNLGVTNTYSFSAVPVQVTLVTGIAGLASQGSHSVVVLTNGTVRGWGDNASGQLALGTTNASVTPSVSQFVAVQTNQAPPVPANVLVNYNGAGKATITWVQGGSLTQSFTIQQSTNNGTSWASIGTVGGDTTSYLASGITGTTNSFRVIANGTYSSSTNSVAATALVSLAITGTNVAPAVLTNTATIQAAAGTISRVDFYEGSDFITSDTASPYTLVLSNVMPGPHVYTAVANSTNGVVGQGSSQVTVFTPDDPMASYRFGRASGTDANYWTYVLSVDELKVPVVLSPTGNNASSFPSGLPWFVRVAAPTMYQVANTNPLAYPAAFQNPIVGFGAAGGGTPLYTGQSYSVVLGAGAQSNGATASDFQIAVYSKSQFSAGQTNVSPLYTYTVAFPQPGTADWDSFSQNGYVRTYNLSTNGTNSYPLSTTLQYSLGAQINDPFGRKVSTPFILTHTATSPDYCYLIKYKGMTYVNGTQVPMYATNTSSPSTSAAYGPAYALDFTDRPAWVSTSLSAPSFRGTPMPSEYAGKSIDELLNVSTPVTYQFAASNATSTNFTALDASPELRTNAVLDKLVSDFGSNPITLANYVLNQIRLSDAISYNSSGSLSETSINLGGVNRSALATYLEKQGSPTEQCALLVYLLRKCGVPAGYVFPTRNTLQMLDVRMSALLRMQLDRMLTQTNSGPQLLPVNYPWVTAYTGGKWVHIFPWMKDTAISEGYDLSDYLPQGYQTGLQWLQKYIARDTNILSLSSEFDNPGVLYPLYVNQKLASNGLTTDDIGINWVDRPHNYYSWTDFPQPWSTATNAVTTNSLVASLSSVTNAFNTFQCFVYSDRNNNGTNDAGEPFLDSGVLRMPDLHNRRIMMKTSQTGSNTHSISLTLEAMRPGATNVEAFPTNGAMILKQSVSTNLGSTDDSLRFRVVYNRNRALPAGFSVTNTPFLSVFDTQKIQDERPLRKGDAAVLCLNFGRVTQDMINVQAQNYWNAQQAVLANTNAVMDNDTAIGTPLYIAGMTYYQRISDFRETIEPLQKQNEVSFFAYGFSKMSPQRTTNGLLPTNGVVNLLYPNVDMCFQRLAFVDNGTANPGNSIPLTQASSDLLHLLIGEVSAQEHTVLNDFYKIADSASTVHLLHASQQQGKQIITLNSTNYATAGNVSYSFGGTNKTLSAWAGADMWNSITNALTPYATNNTNGNTMASFAQVYITPGPIVCASNTYAGVGAFVLNQGGGSAAALITQNMTNAPINGGFGSKFTASSYSLNSFPAWQSVLDVSGGKSSFAINAPTISNPTFTTGNTSLFSLGTTVSNLAAGLSVFNPVMNMLADQFKTTFSFNPSGTTASINSTVFGTSQSSGWTGVSSYFGNMFSQVIGKGVLDPVDVIRGSFYINDTDLTIPGPMPIKLSRNYDSQNLANNEFGFGWKMGYFAYLATMTNSSVMYTAEMDGSVIAYSLKSGTTNTWVPMASNNPSLCNQRGDSVGSVFNPFNNKIVVAGAGTNAIYTLTGADGSVRTFNVASYPTPGTNGVSRQRPYLKTWVDPQSNSLSFSFGTDTNSPDYGFLNRITACNGNFLQLNYDIYGHIISANAADGRRVGYAYDTYGDLVSVTRPDSSVIEYSYSHKPNTGTNATGYYSEHLLTQETKPGGRQLVNAYDANRRVTQQQACVGTGGALTVNGTFTYSSSTNADGTLSGSTQVKDAYNKTTTYAYSGGQLTQVTDPLNQSVTTTWYAAGATNSGAYQRSLASRTDKRGLASSYQYDASGNLTNTSMTGNITGSGSSTAVTATTYNTLNLPTQITEPTGNYTKLTYGNVSYPYLVTSVQKYAAGGGVITQTDTSYTSVGTAGTVPFARGLVQSVTQGGATTSYTYNANGYPATETHPTGSQDPTVSYTLAYNLRGELVKKTDSAGQSMGYSYDDLGNRIWEERSDSGGSLLSWNYNYYNANGEIEWTQGCRYNPCDYTQTHYDQAGRIKEKLVWTAAASTSGGVVSGGVATTTYTHDLFGNLTQILDPMGNKTVMTYDAIGQMLTRVKTGSGGVSASESFTYEPGGKVATYVSPLGGTTSTSYTATGLPRTQSNPDGTSQAWTYLLDGRVASETLPSGATRSTTYDDANRKVTVSNPLYSEVQTFDARGNLLSKTDGEGYTRTTTYDSLNRPKTETGPAGGTGTAQQSVKHSYDAAGLSRTDVNALGETTVTSFDAIGRPTSVSVYGASGGAARQTSYQYSPDHQSTTVTEGGTSGSFVPNGTTTTTDFSGRPIVVTKPDGGTSYSIYDFNGNLTGTADEMGRVTRYSYDGLDHLISQILPDGATISYGRDAAGNMTSRAMPGGLTWSAAYDAASRKTSEQLIQSGSTTRSHTYSYSSTGSGAGQLATMTDPRSIVTTYGYDSLGRRIQEAASDPGGQLGVTRAYALDKRGLLKQVDQSYQNATLSPSSSVVRTLDPYGAIASEQVYVGGALKDSWSQSHNAAGRRNLLTELNNPALPYTFKFDGVGHVIETDFATAGYYFVYGSDGRLYGRYTPVKNQNLSRDYVGRVNGSSQSMSGTSLLNETIAWNPDGTQSGNSITRNGSVSASDPRTYGYNQRGELLLQNFSPSSGLNGSATYQFDGGTAGGLGLRTGVTLGTAMSGVTAQSYSTFARLGSMSVSGSLTNNSVGTPVAQTYDAAGNVTTRTAGGSTDTLTWDAFGQLVKDVRTGTGAFTWSAVYDGLGRRLQTTQGSLTVQSSYDPEVEFLELVTKINGTRNWKVYGPDLDGRYGGLNGAGGLEAVYNQATSTATYVLSDTYGHGEGVLNGTTFTWNPSQSDGYGALAGSSAATPINASSVLGNLIGWRGHYIDPTGFYYLGARYYAPDSGTFLSPDPLGHSASMDLYSYCDGDPVNQYDADGRIGKGAATGVALGGFGQYENTTQQIAGLVGQVGSYFIPGMQGYSAARDIAFSGYSASKAAYDIGENGLNSRNGSELVLSATGLIPGASGVGSALRGESSAVFQEVRQTITLGAEKTAAKIGVQATEGIYEFTAASGKTYVGQSGNIAARMEQHMASGKLLLGTPVNTTEVLGGKTAREIAEQLRINELGGIRNLENIRNPIGANRQYLLPPNP
jgi:RHS repeat-associated protein